MIYYPQGPVPMAIARRRGGGGGGGGGRRGQGGQFNSSPAKKSTINEH